MMKTIFKTTTMLLLLISSCVYGQRGIGTNTPNKSAILELSSTTKGFLLPRMTMDQRDAISLPPVGLMMYCTNCTPPGISMFVDDAWGALVGATGDLEITSCFIEGTFVKGQNSTDRALKVTYKRTSLPSIGTLNFGASDVTLSGDGAPGLSVGTASPASHPFSAAGDFIEVTYPISGTPTNIGQVVIDLNFLNQFTCSQEEVVSNGTATFKTPIVYTLISGKDTNGNTTVQELIPAEGLTVNIPMITGIGTIEAGMTTYGDQKDDDDGANATRFRIRWDAQPAGANNTFVVKIEKDIQGSFFTPRKDLGVTETLQEFPVIINGEEATLIRLDIMGGVPDKNYDGTTNTIVYGAVTSEATGRVWLSRDIGSTARPETEDDANGRGTSFYWSQIAGACPNNWRPPTLNEWDLERGQLTTSAFMTEMRFVNVRSSERAFCYGSALTLRSYHGSWTSTNAGSRATPQPSPNADCIEQLYYRTANNTDPGANMTNSSNNYTSQEYLSKFPVRCIKD